MIRDLVRELEAAWARFNMAGPDPAEVDAAIYDLLAAERRLDAALSEARRRFPAGTARAED